MQLNQEEFALAAADPPENRGVTNEFAPLPVGVPNRWMYGWPFRGIMSTFRGVSDTPVPGAFAGDSLVLTSEGNRLVRGRDFEVDDDWGVATRSREETADIRADYEFRLLRLDALIELPDGVRSLIRGQSHLSNPIPPLVPAIARHVANVFIPYRDTPQYLPVATRTSPPSTPEQTHLLRRTADRLRSGTPIRITCWGDSVTVGGSSSSSWSSFPSVVEHHLQRAGHAATVSVVAVGGTNTPQWLGSTTASTALEQVCDSDPDLLVLEFVNDAELDPESWPEVYAEILRRCEEWDCDLLLVTPHFTRPDWMGHESMSGPDPRPYVHFLRSFCAATGTALADVSRTWERLWDRGLPYLTLLRNGINHPDDRGHAIYAREICAALGILVAEAEAPTALDMRD